jgi:hypothetical protein
LAPNYHHRRVEPKLLNDFTHLLDIPPPFKKYTHLEKFFRVQQKKAVATMNAFQDELKQMSKDVDARNEKRTRPCEAGQCHMPCNAFNPKSMVSAVSI